MILLLACAPTGVPEPEVVAVDYGLLTTDAAGLLQLDVEVEDGDVAGSLYCGPYGFDVSAALASGGGLVDRANPSFDGFTLGWPQAPGSLAAGSHPVQIQFTSEKLPLSVECQGQRRRSEVPESGQVSVEFVFTGLDGLIADDAGEHEAWQLVEDAVIARFATAAIELVPHYHDGDPADANPEDRFAADLIVKTTDVDGAGITVFLVESLGEDHAGHVPGLVEQSGSVASGVVVAAGDLAVDPETVVADITREIGHFLGLFHVVEADGTPDPVADTDDVANPMSLTTPGDSFTADQAWVMRSSLAVSD